MKTLIKGFSVLIILSLAFTSCRKADLAPLSPVGNSAGSQFKTYQTVTDSLADGESIFTDKDKCKRCHTGKSVSIDWKAPYTSNNYKTIEELVANYDFVNNIHLVSGFKSKPLAGISETQKQDLIIYLKSLALNSSQKNK
jgi:hypothetical protein